MLTVLASSVVSDPVFTGAEAVNAALAVSTVTAVTQGPEGFLWIGTTEGLYRYDAYEVVGYSGTDAELPDDEITALHSDGRRLWVGTGSSGLVRYEPDTRRFSVAVPAAALDHARISAIASLPSGTVWVGTGSAGAFELDPSTAAIREWPHDPVVPTSISSSRVTALAADPAGIVYVGSADRGLSAIDVHAGRVTVRRALAGRPGSLPSDRIRALLFDQAGTLWVGTGEGALGRFDPRAGVYEPVVAAGADEQAPLRALAADPSGVVWAARDRSVLQVSDGRVVSRSPVDRTVTSLACDASGVVWAGITAGGLARYARQTERFRSYLDEASTGEGRLVWSFAETSDGVVWVGTDRSGLYRVGPGEETPVRVRADALAGHPVLAAYAGTGLWLALGAGGAALVGDDGAIARRVGDRPGRDPPVLTVHEAGGALYLGTLGGGLHVVDADGSRRRYATGVNDASGRRVGASVTAIEPTGDGDLWLGTDSASLLRFHPGLGVTERRPLVGARASGTVIRGIARTAGGGLWLAARAAGVYHVDPGRDVQVRLEPRVDLPADLAYGVVRDRTGGVWVTTNDGLVRVDERTGESTRYSVADGLPADEFSAGALMAGSDGSVYAGGINGFTRFDPASLTRRDYRPPLVLSRITLPGGEPVRWSDLYRVPRDPASEAGLPELVLADAPAAFSVTVASLDFADSESVAYSHRLVGRDDAWSGPLRDRTFAYGDLEPGAYRLYLRATNGDGVWGAAEPVLDVTVAEAGRGIWWLLAVGAVAVAATACCLASRRGETGGRRIPSGSTPSR